ncbi:MAG: SMC-Scp complex subunit ScpB [bacterium]
MNDKDASKVVEAVLFASPQVLTVRQIARILGSTKVSQVRGLVEGLNTEYERSSRTFRIAQVGDGYQMRTLPLFKTWIQKAEPLKPVRLTQPTLETLAIVAYRQPVTRAEIEHLRGVDGSSALRTLLEHRLVRVLGRDKGPGRALLYGTTRDFLGLFNLTGLGDLPTLEEFGLSVQETAAPAPPLEEAG